MEANGGRACLLGRRSRSLGAPECSLGVSEEEQRKLVSVNHRDNTEIVLVSVSWHENNDFKKHFYKLRKF